MPRQRMRCWPRRQRSMGRLGGQLLAVVAFILTVCVLFRQISHRSTQEPTQTLPYRTQSPLLPQQADFWRELYALILHNDPRCEYPPELVVPHRVDIGFDPDHDHPRPDILWIRPADLKRMQAAHSNLLADLRKSPPPLVYEPDTRGIVLTAGKNQLPVLVIGLRMLRRTDCDLPVEVFLASTADYDPQVCELVLPALHAQCLVFSDVFIASKTGVALEGYQYKVMALLLCSFEDVLLLDHDAFPITDPTALFDNKPFATTGMVLWPDFWFPSESPYFFEIAQLGTPPPLNTRPSIESGEMMFSKSKHNFTLMLAAYYNYHGPQYFYPLVSQGAPGQGDKDTFLWAATVINSNTSFYLVHESVIALGHTDPNGVFVGSAMAQHDPVEDLQHIQALSTEASKTQESIAPVDFGKPNARPQQDSSSPYPFSNDSTTAHAKPLFIHANFPKFDPATIFFYGEEGSARPIIDSNGTAVRAWLSEQQSIAYFGYDIERAFWAEIQYVACNWESMFLAWKDEHSMCENVKAYRQWVFR